MENFLQRMAISSRKRVVAARARESIASLERRADAAPGPLPLKLRNFDLIAELKLKSPALGELAPAKFDANDQLDAYVAGGAAAVSVLTEPDAFNGDLQQLVNAAERLRAQECPVMRKDFLVDPYQVLEARASGASGVLLIAAMLSDAELNELIAAAQAKNLFVLLEAFDTNDLDRLSRLSLDTAPSAVLVGVNSRNLKTLAVDFERFAQLADQIRDDIPAVAESGIESDEDIATVARLGYRLALVGGALMQQGQPARAIERFVAAGRSAIAEPSTCS
jgi:indole-3-glycerol phosphate synthase